MTEKLFESGTLDTWHRSINSEEILPSKGFRRNVTVYALVCYVNNIIGCYLSRNAEPIFLFIERGREHMLGNPATDEWQPYYEKVSSYFEVMEMHLRQHGVHSIYDA